MSKSHKGRFNVRKFYKKNVAYDPKTITKQIVEKFDVLKSDILNEKNLSKMIAPENKKTDFIVRKLQRNRTPNEDIQKLLPLIDYGNDQDTNLMKNEYARAMAFHKFKEDQESADKEFQEGFIKWLKGDMTDEEKSKTPWNEPGEMQKIFLSFKEIKDYLSLMVDVIVESKMLLLKLVETGPQNFHEFFLFYKYIVNEHKLSDLDYFLGFYDDYNKNKESLDFPAQTPFYGDFSGDNQSGGRGKKKDSEEDDSGFGGGGRGGPLRGSESRALQLCRPDLDHQRGDGVAGRGVRADGRR